MRVKRLAVFCELIGYGAKFNLDEIDGKAVLFHGAKNNLGAVLAHLFLSGLDLNVTDDVGRTAVFYCDKDFLRAADEVSINARDLYGRIPLFYAFQRATIQQELGILLRKEQTFTIFNETNVLKALAFAREQCFITNVNYLCYFACHQVPGKW
ncbi:Hypothetical predicted protein [Paramuricea clavata]|uniref:Uncharacterized protein n=1 Tax=Paramuricea clavata TaxID=317549 RepID=A0A7D9IZ13_PARCT|nr:Hypothetical predicted protein [Paramuricea clavata]